jgi:hypothetical protein
VSSECRVCFALGDYPLLDMDQAWDAVGYDMRKQFSSRIDTILPLYVFTSIVGNDFIVCLARGICE